MCGACPLLAVDRQVNQKNNQKIITTNKTHICAQMTHSHICEANTYLLVTLYCQKYMSNFITAFSPISLWCNINRRSSKKFIPNNRTPWPNLTEFLKRKKIFLTLPFNCDPLFPVSFSDYKRLKLKFELNFAGTSIVVF